MGRPPTARQLKLAEELPKNKFNAVKAGRKAGYSESYLRCGEFFKDLRKPTHPAHEMYSEEAKKKELRKLARLEAKLEKKELYTNLLRSKELGFKAKGWIKDKVETSGTPSVIQVNYGKAGVPTPLESGEVENSDG